MVKSIISRREPLCFLQEMETHFVSTIFFPKGMVEKNHIIKVDLAFAKRIRIPYTQKLSPYTSWVYVDK